MSFKSSEFKPSTDKRGADVELCISSPHFPRHKRMFVQTSNFVQISWHWLHNIAGTVPYHSSHRERRWTGVMSVRWMTQYSTKIINWHCENKNKNCSLFQSSKLRKKTSLMSDVFIECFFNIFNYTVFINIIQ